MVTQTNVLMRLNTTTNEVIVVNNPIGDWTPERYTSTAGDQLYLTYTDNSGEETLFSFDGNDFTEITNPTNHRLSLFGTLFDIEDSSTLYFKYDYISFPNPAFQATFYKLEPVVVCNVTGLVSVNELLCFDDNSGEASANILMGTGQVYLDLSFSKTGNVAISIYDVNGKIIMERPSEFISQKEIVFDLAVLSRGLYFVKIQAGDNVLMKRFILQKNK